MIRNKKHPFRTADVLPAGFLEFIYGDGGGDIVGQGQVGFNLDEIIRFERCHSRFTGQDFFGQGHSHGLSIPFFTFSVSIDSRS